MNYQEIVNYLKEKGYAISFNSFKGIECIEVKVDFKYCSIEFIHFCSEELICLPQFLLKNPKKYGTLSHVLSYDEFDLASICIGDQDAVSVNFEKPNFAFKESLDRHISLIKKCLLDKDWNTKELLREFYSNWLSICGDTKQDLICASNADFGKMKVFKPVSSRAYGFESQHIGITANASKLAEFSYIERQKKNRINAGLGFVIPLDNLIPAPTTSNNIKNWYIDTISNVVLPSNILHAKEKVFWLIFNADTPSGKTWFGLHCIYKGKGKKTIPIKASLLDNWKIIPIRVKVFNKDRLMPRSGANISLDKKSVLVVGCGSVGGEIVHKLGAAGIGSMELCDPDIYSLDNIYRHVLQDIFLGCNKALALSVQLDSKYPWIKTKYRKSKLLELRKKDFLEQFDLIVIAIGSPTHERIFHDYIIKNKVNTPVINTWLEGYGIGGHATLDIPSSKGCLRCAYVDMEKGVRGLSSNLNFLEDNQSIVVNHAGCGQLYLPYSAISSAQTALIATNLAISFLMKSIKESSKISWKGDYSEITTLGFQVSHRYTVFDKSLQVIPLYNESCDLCYGR